MSTSSHESANPDRPGRRRTVVRIAIASTVFLVGSLIWIFNANLGFLKPQVERIVSDQIGRELRIDGSLEVLLGASTAIVARDITLANADWASTERMLEVGYLELRVDLWSVLSGPTKIRLIAIDEARISLQRLENGDTNWAFGDQTAVQSAPPLSRDGPAILIEQVDIDQVRLIYDDANRDSPIDLSVAEMDQRHRTDDSLEFEMTGTLGGRSIAGSGEIGTWAELLQRGRVAFDFVGDLDSVHFEARGAIDSLERPRRPSISFGLYGPDIDDLTRMLGAGDDGVGDINLTGALEPQDDGTITLTVDGNLGATDIDALGTASDLSQLDELDIRLQAAGPDLSRVLRWIGIPRIPAEPFLIAVDARRLGSSVDIERASLEFGEARFDLNARLPQFPNLENGAIDLQVNGPDLERFRQLLALPGAAVGPFRVEAGLEVSSEGDESFRASIDTALLAAEASGTLSAEPDYSGTRIDLKVNAQSLADIGSGWGIVPLANLPLEASGTLELDGDKVHLVRPLVATLGDDVLQVEGAVALHSGLAGTEVRIEARGLSLADTLSGFITTNAAPRQAFSVEGDLRIRDDGIRVDSITGSLGQSTLAGNVTGILAAPSNGTRVEFRATGPAFEELFEGLDGIGVAPGAYELSGNVLLREGLIELDDVDLARERVSLTGNLSLGLPLAREHADFDIQARGANIRELLREVKGFEADDAEFRLDANGKLRDAVWTIDELQAAVGDATLNASGDLNFREDIASTRFSFSGDVPSLARLGTIGGYRLRDQVLRWSGSVTGDAGSLRMENFAAKIGDSDISGSVVWRPGPTPELDLNIKSGFLQFAPVLEEPGAEEPGEVDETDNRLVPDVQLPFESMARLNASLNIRIGELWRDTHQIRNVRLAGRLSDGVLTMNEFGFNPRSGRLDGRLTLDPAGGSGRAVLEVVARDFALGASEMNQDLLTTGDIDLKIEGTGADLRSLLGSATGAAIVDMRGGRIINRRFLQAIYGDLVQEILQTINPFARTENITRLDCFILPYKIDAGRMQQAPSSLIRTGKLQIATQGSVDLNTEALDITIRTRPRSGLTISAGELVNPFTKVVGTLSEPKLAVDEQGVLVTGGAAVATGGVSLLAKALWDRIGQSTDPCADVSKQAHELLDDRLPAWRDNVSTDVRH